MGGESLRNQRKQRRKEPWTKKRRVAAKADDLGSERAEKVEKETEKAFGWRS